MSEADARTFGKRLEKERLERGWSQKYLAEKLGTTESTVSRWERGETFPQSYSRQKLQEVLGRDLYKLGLLEAEAKHQEAILENITGILQQRDDTNLSQKLHMILDYVAEIAAHNKLIQHPSVVQQTEYMTSQGERAQLSSTEYKAVIVRTEEQEHAFLWVGVRNVYLDRVVSIETGDQIASWRYFQRGKEQREPHNFDMHIHVCRGQIVRYAPPILLTRLFMLPTSTNARCIKVHEDKQDE